MSMVDKRFVVQVSEHLGYPIQAEDGEAAKSKVWDELEGHYTYGYTDRADFMKRAKVTEWGELCQE